MNYTNYTEEELRDLAAQVAGYIAEYGWTQGSFGPDGGPRCIYGAMGSCTDDYWIKEALCDRLVGDRSVSSWNDEPKRTKEEVIGLLQDYAEGNLKK